MRGVRWGFVLRFVEKKVEKKDDEEATEEEGRQRVQSQKQKKHTVMWGKRVWLIVGADDTGLCGQFGRVLFCT